MNDILLDMTFYPKRFRYTVYCWQVKGKRSLIGAIKYIINPHWSPL